VGMTADNEALTPERIAAVRCHCERFPESQRGERAETTLALLADRARMRTALLELEAYLDSEPVPSVVEVRDRVRRALVKDPRE
jgi:hypothetical protein